MLKPEWLTSDGDAAYTHVSRMIEDALSRYSNDRLGKTDFALFSAGARIIPGLTSPTFEPPARGLTQKLWRKMGMISSQPPVAILDPNTHIGECWPMQGSSGQVAIHLAQPVGVSDFAIEHVAKSIAIDWRSAPREIEVWGYIIGSEDSTTKHGLGRLTKLASFEYEPSDTSALQVIRPAVGDGSALRMRTIILKIKSNWGHPEHTCIYRFRVHGHLVAL
ncbi:UNC-like C-terminal-domain-containing protein [Coemansia spiralis]|nr:UNC-like C-terminal-domain-containing protein [Coemansia spiralis]